MEVNERRTVVGGWLATVCPPNRGERSTRIVERFNHVDDDDDDDDDDVCAVSGCGDYVAPPGVVATRARDRVTVECSSGAQWELRCELGRWVGPTYNCSDAEWTQAWTIGRLLNNSAHFSKRQGLHLLAYLLAYLLNFVAAFH